jgi:hypothetical protein
MTTMSKPPLVIIGQGDYRREYPAPPAKQTPRQVLAQARMTSHVLTACHALADGAYGTLRQALLDALDEVSELDGSMAKALRMAENDSDEEKS